MAECNDNSDTVLEGFLCPICKADLRSQIQLTSHFKNEHSEDQELLKVFKGIFSTAKKKIKIFDDFENSRPWRPESEYQEMGQCKSHTVYFKQIRNSRLERYAAETNKLLIRLDKLVTNIPFDSAARRQHEQKVVPWLDGDLVSRCPGCARQFHLARRQHHCRLCGAILCHDCCHFLPLSSAYAMTNPALAASSESAVEASPPLRLCEHCDKLLQSRRCQQEARTTKPLVVKLYEKLREEIERTQPDVEQYIKMCLSLREGNSTYSLSDAAALRGHLGTRGGQIEKIGKAILGLPTPEDHVRTRQLHRAIQQAATLFLKSEILSLPSLPTDDQYREIKERREAEAIRRIEAERRALDSFSLSQGQNAANNTQGKDIGIAQKNKDPVMVDGWTGLQMESGLINASDDPLIEQINIIQGYIKQARQAMRFDEVATLEANLKELQQEFYHKVSKQTLYNN